MVMKNRKVNITSLSFQGHPQEEILDIVRKEAAKKCDLIILPETWSGEDTETLEKGTTVEFKKIAKEYGVYIINSVALETQEHARSNSAILINREGEVQGIYNKMYPYWAEYDLKPEIFIGDEAPVFETDFGRIGIAICFDANFNLVWEQLARKKADIVLWTSAYSAGRSLQAHAVNYNYAIVSSTLVSDCVAYDINGDEIFYQRAENSDVLVSHVMLDTNRAIFHTNFNDEGREKLLTDYVGEVTLEKSMWREQWFILKGSDNVQVKKLAKEYGMEELWDYKHRSREAIDKMRSKQRRKAL